MSNKKRDLIIFVVAVILLDLFSWFILKSSWLALLMSDIVIAIIFFRPKKVRLVWLLIGIIAVYFFLFALFGQNVWTMK